MEHDDRRANRVELVARSVERREQALLAPNVEPETGTRVHRLPVASVLLEAHSLTAASLATPASIVPTHTPP